MSNVNNNINNLLSPMTGLGRGPILCMLPGCGGAAYNLTQNVASLNYNTSLFLTPFYSDQDFSLTNLETYAAVGVAASTLTLGIYGSTTTGYRQPTGAPLVVGQSASTSQGRKQIALTLSLQAGQLYWAAIQLSVNTVQVQVVTAYINPSLPSILKAGTGYTIATISYVNTYSAGALPTINPASLVYTSGFNYPSIAYS